MPNIEKIRKAISSKEKYTHIELILLLEQLAFLLTQKPLNNKQLPMVRTLEYILTTLNWEFSED